MPFENLSPRSHHSSDEMTNLINHKNWGAKPLPKHSETTK